MAPSLSHAACYRRLLPCHPSLDANQPDQSTPHEINCGGDGDRGQLDIIDETTEAVGGPCGQEFLRGF